MIEAAGANVAGVLPQSSTPDRPSPEGNLTPVGLHTMGGMRMAPGPDDGVTDGTGRLFGLANVGVADGAVFPTSGAHNPTLTIVAMAWRNAQAWTGAATDTPVATTTTTTSPVETGSDGGVSPAVAAGVIAAGATVGGAAAYARSRHRDGTEDA